MGRVALALVVVGAVGAAACSSAAPSATPARPVLAAPPPRDDGKTAKGDGAGSPSHPDAHSAALEQLRTAPTTARVDKQNSVAVPLPDGANWTRVRFLTVPSLVGFRYGKAHHAIVAGFITHVPDNTVEGACNKSFESWATPWIEAFDVDLRHDAPSAFPWSMPTPKAPPVTVGPPRPIPTKQISIVDVDPLMAKTATVLSRELYAAAWVAYPAWEKSCLVVGVAIPARDDEARARDVRDRFVTEVFPKVAVVAQAEPKERY